MALVVFERAPVVISEILLAFVFVFVGSGERLGFLGVVGETRHFAEHLADPPCAGALHHHVSVGAPFESLGESLRSRCTDARAFSERTEAGVDDRAIVAALLAR
jgi:hypothetical protein